MPHLLSDTPSLYLKPPELTTIKQNKTKKELDRGGVDFISFEKKIKTIHVHGRKSEKYRQAPKLK